MSYPSLSLLFSGRDVAPDRLCRLIRDSARGQELAFAELYDLTAGWVFGIALRMTGSEARAAEVTKETFAVAWLEALYFRPESGTVLSWLVRIAHSRAVRTSRREPVTAPSAGRADQVKADQVEEDRVLHGLTWGQREAVRMAWFEGGADRDVAQALGISVDQARAEIRTGLNELVGERAPWRR